MKTQLCHGPHAWEPDGLLSELGEWYDCPRCHALGRKEGAEIVVVKCTECDEPAATLWSSESGNPHVPVCENHVSGVILR